MYSRVYTLPLFALVTLLLSTLGATGQTVATCDTIDLADRTVYVMRGEKDSQIEVAHRLPEGQELRRFPWLEPFHRTRLEWQATLLGLYALRIWSLRYSSDRA